MRIVQIIDSLDIGGAERMALNYANVLSEKIEFSGLIASRKEGLLLSQIDEKVTYLFLNKKKIIDFKATLILRKYLKSNKVNVIHAHSSSFFIAVLVKLILPKIKIIWHDHYGISQDLKSRRNVVLKLSSLFFKGSIAVNSALRDWAESYLYCKNVIYFSNFVDERTSSNEKVSLNGEEGKRIVCVANLRPQKNHELLIKAANIIRNEYPDWTFHLFGKDFLDDHSKKLKKLVTDLELDKNIFFYGTVNNVASVLKQCNIAVLSSISEGLPLAILEYGLYKLPVVATNVGEISTMINSEKEGLIVESNDIEQFLQSIQKLIRNEKLRIEMGLELNKIVSLNYSQKTIARDYISWLNYLINFIPSKHI